MGSVAGSLGNMAFGAAADLVPGVLKSGGQKALQGQAEKLAGRQFGAIAENPILQQLKNAKKDFGKVKGAQKTNRVIDEQAKAQAGKLTGSGKPILSPLTNHFPASAVTAHMSRLTSNAKPSAQSLRDTFFKPTSSLRPDTSNWQFGSSLI